MLSSQQSEELLACLSEAIHRCAEDDDSRDAIFKCGGIPPLVELLSKGTNSDTGLQLLVSATAAIWRCAATDDNASAVGDAGGVSKLFLVSLSLCSPEATNQPYYSYHYYYYYYYY